MNRPPVSITLWFLSWYSLLYDILDGSSIHTVSISPFTVFDQKEEML